jgi:hypothetical protein
MVIAYMPIEVVLAYCGECAIWAVTWVQLVAYAMLRFDMAVEIQAKRKATLTFFAAEGLRVRL